MVKSMNQDIKKGRKFKKILTVVTIPLVVLILLLSWMTYKGNNRVIVPIEDFSKVEVKSDEKTNKMIVQGQVKLKTFETISLTDTEIIDGVMYIMIYKDPKLFSKEKDFKVDIDNQIQRYRMSKEELKKIDLTYFDIKELNGYERWQLQDEFPKKTIWEKE